MADKNGNLHASHCTIAARAGMRREHAARTTAQLERRGLLRVRVRGRTVGSQGKRTANEYEMLAPPFINSASSSTIAEVK
jgi:DNA-binding IscR family transcriptional regulator